MTSPKYEITFGSVREHVLRDIWVANTTRKLLYLDDIKYVNLFYDDFSESYECGWQEKAQGLRKDVNWHVPHFCSLGDWAGNITDLLTDYRYDDLLFTEPIDKEFLFRYYVRFLVVTSEILSDFDSIICEADLAISKQKPTRLRSLSSHIDVHRLIGYTNTVCKHKNSSKLHFHNHHLNYWFEDSCIECPFVDPVSLSNTNLSLGSKPDGINVPSLSNIVTGITDGYKTLNELFENNPKKFKSFCLKVGDQYEYQVD